MLQELCAAYNKYEMPLVITVWVLAVSALIFLGYNGYVSATLAIQFILISVALLVFIIFDKYKPENIQQQFSHNPDEILRNLPVLNRKVELVFRILFFVGVITTLLILPFFDVRPLAYFIICGIMAGILSTLILFSNINKSPVLPLVRIGIFSLITSLSIFKIYYFVGNDTWAHAAWNELVAFTGAMDPTMGKEFGYPLHHIFVALYQILGNVDVRTATIICVSVPTVLSAIVVFVIGQKFVGKKFALISTLILTLFPAFILNAIQVLTTSTGVTVIYFLVLMYVFWEFPKDKKYSSRHLVIYFALIGVLSLTHQFSAFMFLTILVGVYLASIIINHKIFTKELFLTMSTGIIMMVVWLSVSFGFTNMIGIIIRQFSALSSTSSAEGIVSLPSAYVNIQPPNVFQMIIDSGTIFLYIAVLVISYICFKLLITRKDNSRSLNYLIIISSVSLILFIAVVATTVLGSGMAKRYAGVLALFVALSLAYILYHVFNKSWSKKQLTICAVILCIIISGFSMVSLTASANATDNPLLIDGKDRVRGVSISELQAMETMSQSLHFMNEDTVYLENPEIRRAFEFIMGKVARTQGEVIHSTEEVINYGTINWDESNLNDGEYLIYRSLLSDRPSYQYIVYATGKNYGQIYQPLDRDFVKLDNYNNVIYNNNALYWLHGF